MFRARCIAGAVAVVLTLTATACAPEGSPRATAPPVQNAGADTWKLVLEDQFDGTTLNRAYWAPCYWWSTTTCTGAGNHEQQLYTRNNVAVNNGMLSLTARKQLAFSDDGSPFLYTSGIVSGSTPSKTMVPFQYGYVEARARVPKGSGLWSALWMLPANHREKPEIDIFEIVGETPHLVYQSLHAVNQQAAIRHVEQSPDDMTADWHVYGVDWEPTGITWYVDGRKTFSITDPNAIPRVPMYLVIDLAVGGDFPTKVTPTTPFPSSLQVDDVRVWQRH